MGAAVIDLLGQQFGMLEVIGRAPVKFGQQAMWQCLCDCGVIYVARGSSLRNGLTTHCGCSRKAKHGHSRKGAPPSPTYIVWRLMVQRCYNPKATRYSDYGGRGIRVCARWLPENNGFVNFLADMGERPEGLTLDRRNVNGHYIKSNCRWATRKMQANNTRKQYRIDRQI